MPGLVLLIDTCELLAPLDAWLRDVFLPQLPEQAIVVMAGRQQPAAAWRADDGWGALARIISLRNLRPDESAAYLTAQGIPTQDVDCVLSVTYGHPLALALIADLYKQNDILCGDTCQREPDIVRVLLERFVAEVPNAVLRQALEVCAHALNTDEISVRIGINWARPWSRSRGGCGSARCMGASKSQARSLQHRPIFSGYRVGRRVILDYRIFQCKSLTFRLFHAPGQDNYLDQFTWAKWKLFQTQFTILGDNGFCSICLHWSPHFSQQPAGDCAPVYHDTNEV